MSASALFAPISVAGLQLRNRTVMAPMTRRFSPGGLPTEKVADYYRRRAEAGVGVIITEGVAIDHPAAIDHPDIPHFHGPALNNWKVVAELVKAAGAAFIPQLWHMGGHRSMTPAPPNSDIPSLSPSGIYQPGITFGAPATEAEIATVIEAYAKAAGDAVAIGASGVEVHGAHGYLIDQFLWSSTNQRSDRYGGDLTGRLRFTIEVISACRAAVGPDFPIFFRFSQFKQVDYKARLCRSPDELAAFLEPLVDAGVDVFDCSQRRFWEPEFEGSPLNLAGWTKKLSGKPTMTVGSVGLDGDVVASLHEGVEVVGASSLDKLEVMLERGDFDLVGVGRALLADPLWVEKVRDSEAGQLVGFSRQALETLV
ncbi:1,2-oxophytodienoate reductase [Caulobacter sp. Root655]|uniref:NADH:flavin oxidoreductase n=1 Tax=Caulobacter sp. Root655 TaxID=1736578 RepID=UPI0006FC9131|nr:NADH:flavin oxidoreductase [Caulobacter sp. Root655]KRA60383.1 1,2-oxophytodienoate reductase [Caulobacter sp. Root655]